MNRQIQPISHRDVIKAWANGAIIQVYDEATGTWEDCHGNDPAWFATSRYRVKPTTRYDENDTVRIGDDVWFVSTDLQVERATWEASSLQLRMLEAGNMFFQQEDALKTAEAAQKLFSGEKGFQERSIPNVDGFPLSQGEKCVIRSLREITDKELEFLQHAEHFLAILQKEQKARRAAAEDYYHSLAY